MSVNLEDIVDTEEIEQSLSESERIVAERDKAHQQKAQESRERNVVKRKRGGLRKPYVKFTIAMQRKFLKEFAKIGNIAGAAARIGVDRKTVYNERNKNEAFKQALDIAKENLAASLEDYAIDRVINGEKVVKKDGDGNVIEETTKPCSPAFAVKVLEAKTESYAKTTESVNTQSDENAAIKKLAGKLGITLDDDKIKAVLAKEIDGEVIEGEFEEQ